MECQYKTISSNGDTEREWLRGWVVYRKEPQGNEINQHMNKQGNAEVGFHRLLFAPYLCMYLP